MKYLSLYRIVLCVCLVLISSLSFASETGTITGKVMLSDINEPASDANVLVREKNTGAISSINIDTSGIYSFRFLLPGTYQLIISSLRYDAQKFDNVIVVPDSTITLNVSLKPQPARGINTGIITGRVLLDYTNEPAANVLVMARQRYSHSGNGVTTDTCGRYKISNLISGVYDLIVSNHAKLVASVDSMIINADSTTRQNVTLKLSKSELIGTVTGNVLLSDNGKPAVAATVQATELTTGTKVDTKTNYCGDYTFKLPPGNYNLRFSTFDYEPVTIKSVIVRYNLAVKQDTSLKPIGVKGTGTITGKVMLSEINESAPIASILAFELNTELKTGTKTDWDGLYVLHIPPGIYKLRFSMVGYTAVIVDSVVVKADSVITKNVTLEQSHIYYDGPPPLTLRILLQ